MLPAASSTGTNEPPRGSHGRYHPTTPKVIQATITLDMCSVPGIATPTDAFQAIELGASCLKLFPASTYGSGHLRALLAVLPKQVGARAVGGIGPGAFDEWRAAGKIDDGTRQETGLDGCDETDELADFGAIGQPAGRHTPCDAFSSFLRCNGDFND